MHLKDADNTYREQALEEFHKNATSYIEQILEAAPHDSTAVQPLTSHHTDHPNKTNKTCRTMLE